MPSMEEKVNKCHKKSYKEALTGKSSVECETGSVEEAEYPSLISPGAENTDWSRDWRPPPLLSLGPREDAHEVTPTVSLKTFSSQKRRNKTLHLRHVESLLFLPTVSQVKEIFIKNNSRL